MKRRPAEIIREFGPYEGVKRVNGVTYDGKRVWIAADDKLCALDPSSGDLMDSLDVAAHAGTAYDGRHLYQIAESRIQKIDPASGRILATIPAPAGGCSGMAWAEGSLWVGQYRARKIHQIDPDSGEVLRTIESKRFVTGVTWDGGDIWHGTMDGDESGLCHIDPESGAIVEQIDMPAGMVVSGLESDGQGAFYCGGASSGMVRVVRRPSPNPQAAPGRAKSSS